MGAQGPKVGQKPGPFAEKPGDVAYLAAFAGSFVMHSLEDARAAALPFTSHGKICVFRIEVIDVFPQSVAEPEHAPE